jgi:hypothetical protein
VLESVFGRALDPSDNATNAVDRRSKLAMEFTRVINPVEDLEIWVAISDGFSFAISHESRSGPGFHGPTGYVASWRAIHPNRGAIRIGGSPFSTLTEAEEACRATLGYLTSLSQE